MTFNGELIDACLCFFHPIDVDIDVTSIITLSLPHENVLRTDIRTTYDADDAEVFCCALTAGLFLPVVIAIYMAEGKVNFGMFIASLMLQVHLGPCSLRRSDRVPVALGANRLRVSRDSDCTEVMMRWCVAIRD